MHIDILVIIDNKWFPIELKYKTKKDVVEDYDGENYSLKYHGAKDINCYAYIKDIQRIEKIRDNLNNNDSYPDFGKGYTIFITNDESYTKKPREDAYYREFSLDNGRKTKNKMSWDNRASKGTIGNRDKSIKLSDTYTIKWEDYNDKDFKYLMNMIDNS